MFINTLSLEDFITEKIKAYKSMGYVRDFYDIYHLLSSNGNTDKKLKRKLKAFLKSITPPKDEKQLKELVYVGAAPSFDTMLNYIKDASNEIY